jgi:formamidopyrimidine-DNA glycosylase
MPELPEVETVARQLAPVLVGRRVLELRILDPRLRVQRPPRLTGRRIEAVERCGKRVLIEFGPAGDPRFLAVHLRMTGRLSWRPDDVAPDPTSRKHLRAQFRLDRGRLLFADARRFGTFAWYPTRAEAEPAGIDPLSPQLDAHRLDLLIDHSVQNVKTWLLRQDRLVGIGNIYASEILHAAGISPQSAIGALDPLQRRRLLAATRRILTRAIRACGTTFSDFEDAYGLSGSYQRYLAVYEREDRPCRRCATPIARVVQGQRSTYHCPGCQR